MYTPRVSYNEWVDRRLYADELLSKASSELGLVQKYYVRCVDALSKYVGTAAMYLIIVMLAILTYSTVTTICQTPSIWVMESAQFTMAAYYILGGAFTMQQGIHVRMDFLYEKWSPRKRAIVDCVTMFFVLFYLYILVLGGWESSSYALEYGQRNRTVWAPYMAPIKIAMTFGMLFMFMQAIAELIKDAASLIGKDRTL